MGIRPAECANHSGSRVYAWSGIKAVFTIAKMLMFTFACTARMFALDWTLWRIRYHFSTKRENRGTAPAFPTLRRSLQKALRIDIASQYFFGPRQWSRLFPHLSRENDMSFICQLVRSHHLKSALERTCQP